MVYRLCLAPTLVFVLGCASGSGPPSPGCADGVQNGDEQALDCGGSCAPCVTIDALTPTWAVAGESYAGMVTVTGLSADSGSLELIAGPSGMVLRTGTVLDRLVGELSWLPTLDQGGSQSVTIRLSRGRAVVDKTFVLDVAGVELAETKALGPEGGTVEVTDAKSPLHGISVQIPAGVLSKATQISIGTVEGAIPLPNDVDLAGPLFYLGPAGLTFNGLPAKPPQPSNGTELQEAIDAFEAAEQPVTVTIPRLVDADEGSQLILLTLQPDARGYLTWLYVDAKESLADGSVTLTAPLGHFSVFATAAAPMPAHYSKTKCEDALAKIAALRQAWAVAQKPTHENLETYAWNLVDPEGRAEMALWPGGPKSCSTHADALCEDLNSNATVREHFTAHKVNSGFIQAGASLPLTHYLSWLKPNDGVGPSYLVDRYVNSAMHLVKGSIEPFSPVPGTKDGPRYSHLYEALTKGTIDRYFHVETLPEAAETIFDAWEKEIGGPIRLAGGIQGIIECEDAVGVRHPLTGVRVEVETQTFGVCESGPAAPATSDQDGAFLVGPPGDEVCIPCRVDEQPSWTLPMRGTLASSHGHTWSSGLVNVTGTTLGSGEPAGRVLWPGSLVTTIRGRIIDAEGNPVPNADVSLREPSGHSVVTRSDGTFVVPDVPGCGLATVVVKATSGAAGGVSAPTDVVLFGDTLVGDIAIGGALHWLLIGRSVNAPVYSSTQLQSGHEECNGITGGVLTDSYANDCAAPASNDLYVVGFHTPQSVGGFSKPIPQSCEGYGRRRAATVTGSLTAAEAVSMLTVEERVERSVHKFCTDPNGNMECHKNALSALPGYRLSTSHRGGQQPLSVSPIAPDEWLSAAITEMGWAEPVSVYHSSQIRAGLLREVGTFSYHMTILLDGAFGWDSKDETGITLHDNGVFYPAVGDVPGTASEEVKTQVFLGTSSIWFE